MLRFSILILEFQLPARISVYQILIGISIYQTYDGGYVVTGSTMSYGDQSEIILLKLDASGIVDDIIGDLNTSSGN